MEERVGVELFEEDDCELPPPHPVKVRQNTNAEPTKPARFFICTRFPQKSREAFLKFRDPKIAKKGSLRRIQIQESNLAIASSYF
jgi:hypothetical protein